MFAGLGYLIFYVYRNKKYWPAKIQLRHPPKSQLIREISYSVISILIFGGVITLTVMADEHGLTTSYQHIADRGIPYFIFSVVLMIFMHDTYYYWTHRLMHWKPLFRLAHCIHHLSTDPTPFSSYSFHPIDAIVQTLIIPIIVFTIPYHPYALITLGFYSIFLNVAGHLGFDFLPRGFATHKIYKWLNTATHHDMHHRLVKCNYGLYFNIWDRILKTNHPHYEENFDKITARRDQHRAEVLVDAVDDDCLILEHDEKV